MQLVAICSNAIHTRAIAVRVERVQQVAAANFLVRDNIVRVGFPHFSDFLAVEDSEHRFHNGYDRHLLWIDVFVLVHFVDKPLAVVR